jgi:putative aldouronate transport system substrate-binding protein
MKKALLFASALLCIASLAFAGGQRSAPSAASTAPGGLAPVELIWYMPNSIQPDMQIVNDEINKILKEKINATVQINFIDWGEYDQRMNIMTAAGDPMDMFYTSNWTNDYITMVNKGALQPIPFEKIQQLAPNMISAIPEKLWPAVRVKGEIYALPNLQVEARWPAVLLLKKYVDKYNFDVSRVTKLDDFTPLFTQIQRNEPGIIPFALDKSEFLSYMVSNMGLEYFADTMAQALYINDASARVVNLYETPELMNALKVVRSWYQAGIIPVDVAAITDWTARKAAGRVAAQFAVNNPDTLADQSKRYSCEPSDLVMVPLSDPFMYTGSIINTLTGISTQSKNMDRCIMLYNLLFDENDTRLINLISFGIEGRHYTKISDTQIRTIDNSGYFINSGWEYGHMFLTYSLDPATTQPQYLAMEKRINNTAMTSSILGFSFDPTPVKSEIAVCQATIDEYFTGLMTGSVDPEVTIPRLLARLKDAGNDKITAEMQKQINEWKAANGK